jgi:predicted amidophosphoribosyltransferase
MRLFGGLRLGRVGPFYLGLRLFSVPLGGRRKRRSQKRRLQVIYTCSACGGQNRPDARFCQHCGAPLSGRIIGP